MLELLRKLLSITFYTTQQLQTFFGGSPPTEEPKSESDIKSIVGSLYSFEEIPEMIIPIFFIIPKAFVDLSAENTLKMINCLADLLVENLPWILKNPALRIHDSILDEQQICVYIQEYCKTLEQKTVGVWIPSPAAHATDLPTDNLFRSYLSTVIAYTMLDMMSTLVIEGFPQQTELSARLAKLKRICDLYLINNALEWRNGYRHMSLGAVFNSFLQMTNTEPEAEIPPVIRQVKQSLHKMADYAVVKHCMCIHTLSNKLDMARSFDDIKELVIKLITNPDKPLINVWNHNASMLYIVVKFIFNDKSDPIKTRTLLMLLVNGLKPSSAHQDSTARFNFLYFLYREYVLKNDDIPFKASVLNAMVNAFLEEPAEISSYHVGFFLNYILVFDQMFPTVNFGLSLALCLSSVPSVPMSKKKEVFAGLMSTADASKGIAINWSILIQNPMLTEAIEDQYHRLYGYHIAHQCFNDTIKLNPLLNAFNKIQLQYWEITIHHPSLLLLDRIRSVVKMVCIAEGFLNVINNADEANLAHVIKTCFGCDESLNKILFLLVIRAEPLANIIKELFIHDPAQKSKSDQLDMICFEPGYLNTISRLLFKLDPKNPPPFIMHVLLSDEGANLRVKLLLILLVVLSRKVSHPITPKKYLWINWVLSLFKEIMVSHPETKIGKNLSHLSLALDISSTLPAELQTKFLETIQPKPTAVETLVVEPPLEDELATATHPTKSKKPRKKPVAKKPETANEEHSPSSKEATKKLATETKESAPDVKPTKEPEVQLVPEPIKQTPEMVLPHFIKYQRALLSCMSHLSNLINQLLEIQLPPGFALVIAKAQEQVLTLEKKLPTQSSGTRPKESIKIISNYSEFNTLAKLHLEKEWNKQLAEFSWDVQRALEKYLQPEKELKMTVEQSELVLQVQAVLTSISHCYFKNLHLHLPEEVIHVLKLIESYYENKQVRVSIKGSTFALPQKARDLDLLLIPQHPLKDVILDRNFFDLCTPFGGRIFPGTIFQMEDFVSQAIQLVLPNRTTINLDVMTYKDSLTPEQELEKTSLAKLSMCAVNWYLDGHACMQAQTARAICCDSPVLKLLIELKTTEEYAGIAGYLLKNIIKYGDLVRHDPPIKKFLEDYIHPETRYSALPNSSKAPQPLSKQQHPITIQDPSSAPRLRGDRLCRAPSPRPRGEGSIDKKSYLEELANNQTVVSEGLHYLFNRFSSRTTETIHFIMSNKLLRVLFPLTEETHQHCTDYFHEHFLPLPGQAFHPNLSAPAFLAMFFLGCLMERPEEKRAALIEELKHSLSLYQKALTMTNTIRILELIPISINGWAEVHTEYQAKKATQSKQPFEVETILLIFNTWHPNLKTLNEAHEVSPANLTEDYNPHRFFPTSHAEPSTLPGKQLEQPGRCPND